MDIKQLKEGSILSETSFFTVQKIEGNNVEVKDDQGNILGISKEYVEQILNSADIFEKEEKKTMTELADLLISSPRIAMTVAFYKKDTAKTQKVYKQEVAEAIAKVQSAKVSEVEGLLTNLIENPISKTIPGEFRVMKGRHYGKIDELGRLHFVDMEIARTETDRDDRIRQVDPRSVQYIIVNNVKYSLKK